MECEITHIGAMEWMPHGRATWIGWWHRKILCCVKKYSSMSTKYVRGYTFWHGQNLW
jgi:hypothetical protein